MVRKSLIFMLLVGTALAGYSQYEMDLLNYSQKIYMSDARSAGAGNAFSAIGANLISGSLNPAGFGFNRKTEFIISNAFYLSNSESEYLGSKSFANKVNYNIPSVGFVFSNILKENGVEKEEGWISYSFAMGINRTNNFHERAQYSGVNMKSSYLDYFAERAQGYLPKDLDFYSGMAYDAYFIDNPDTMQPSKYFTAFDTSSNSRNVDQTINLRTGGATTDINFSFGGNYDNIIFLGGSIGIPSISYHRNLEFVETNLDPNENNYNQAVHQSILDVSGVGVNATLGLIIKPVQLFRIGASIQTPTVYKMNESWQEEMDASLKLVETSRQLQYGSFDYSLVTPFRSTIGAALFLGKFGFISADYEHLNYTSAYFDSDIYSMMSSNNKINDYYKSVNNIRVGAEFRYEILSLRAGYGIYESPYKNDIKPSNHAGEANVLSFGLGVRDKNYYFDVAYQTTNEEHYYLPYSLTNTEVEGATEKLTKNNIIITLGLRM